LRVLYPYTKTNGESDVNRSSIVMVFEIGNDVFYLGGDAPSDVEDNLLLSDEITIAKASHHGSHTSTSAYFLNKIRPQDVVISSGAENRYGHPHDDVLTRAFRTGAQVLRTDQVGSIVYSCDQYACTR
jgi:competence protein ComEC